MFNKKGRSSGGILTIVVIALVILFRVYHEMGPENFNIITIGKYVAEIGIFVGAWLGASRIAQSERIKSPVSTILIGIIAIVAIFCMYKLWRL